MAGPVTAQRRTVEIPAGRQLVQADLSLPESVDGLVIFAHGSGSGRHSPRNRYVAERLNRGQIGTLLVDLLTIDEQAFDAVTGSLRFDMDLLADRLGDALRWVLTDDNTRALPVGLFGASTGAGAALIAAAAYPAQVRAVVSRGGRPDLAGIALPDVRSPTLFIVGANDPLVIELNRDAFAAMVAPRAMEIVPGAGHLFEEPGTLERAAQLAEEWFARHLRA